MFKLGVIEESLKDKQLLQVFKPYIYSQRIENKPEDEYPIWHVNEYHVEDEKIEPLLDLLKDKLRETWYIHAFNENSLYVVLQHKWFKISLHRDDTWEEMINYGISVAKVDRWYLENIPLHI